MKKKTRRVTILDIIDKLLDSDLPVSTRNSVARHYLLPSMGMAKAPIEIKDSGVGFIGRPTAEELEIENNPLRREEELDTERLMNRGKLIDEDEDDE